MAAQPTSCSARSLMTTSGPGPTLDTAQPSVCGHGRAQWASLYVADAGNDRVLRFDDIDNKASGAIANGRLGQSGQPSATTMDVPSGVAMDSAGRLYVVDKNHNRVLVFNDAQNKPHGAAADNVLGHIDFGVALNGNVGGVLPGTRASGAKQRASDQPCQSLRRGQSGDVLTPAGVAAKSAAFPPARALRSGALTLGRTRSALLSSSHRRISPITNTSVDVAATFGVTSSRSTPAVRARR